MTRDPLEKDFRRVFSHTDYKRAPVCLFFFFFFFFLLYLWQVLGIHVPNLGQMNQEISHCHRCCMSRISEP
jgi:hypothetical protein